MRRPPSCESSDQEQHREAGPRLGDRDQEDCKEGDLLDRRVLHLLGPRMVDWEARRDRLSKAEPGQQQKREMDQPLTLWTQLAEETMIALEEGADKLLVDPVKGSAARRQRDQEDDTERGPGPPKEAPRRQTPHSHAVALQRSLGSVRELMVHERARCCGGRTVAGPAPRAVRLHV